MRSGGRAGVLRRVVSRTAISDQAKQLESCREKCPPLQGPGTAGMIVWRSQARLAIGRRRRSKRAAGLNARPPCVDGMRWRVNGLSCAVRRPSSPSFGAWPTKGHLRCDEKTASLGNGWQGALRAGTLTRTKQASASLADRLVLIAPSSRRHTWKKMPEATQ